MEYSSAFLEGLTKTDIEFSAVLDWLSTTPWRRMDLSFTPQSLYHRGNSPRYLVNKGLCGLHGRYGWGSENSKPFRDSKLDPSVVQPVASRYKNYAILTKTKRNSSIACLGGRDLGPRTPEYGARGVTSVLCPLAAVTHGLTRVAPSPWVAPCS
jgi:hypothetical protein